MQACLAREQHSLGFRLQLRQANELHHLMYPYVMNCTCDPHTGDEKHVRLGNNTTGALNTTDAGKASINLSEPNVRNITSHPPSPPARTKC